MRSPLFDIENWREIGATLARNKTRTFMTAFGIFWGTAMLAMLWGGSKGAKDLVMRNFDGLATNMGAISAWRTTVSYNGYNKGMSWDLNTRDVDNLRKYVPQLEEVTSMSIARMAPISYETKSTTAQIKGLEPNFAKVMEPVINEGRFLSEIDIRNKAKVCVLGKKVAQELFGTGSPLGKYVNVGGIYYLTVGVASQTSEASIGGAQLDESVVIPVNVLQVAYNAGEDVDAILFTVKKGYTPTKLMPHIRRIITGNHPNVSPEDEDAMWLMDVTEMFEMGESLFTGLSLLALFVGAGTLLAGVIGVGNIMWIIVKERTHEIGIRRALGAKPKDVIMQILSESMVLTTIAGTAGIVFASIALAVTTKLTETPGYKAAGFELPFTTAVVILLLFLILGSAAGIVPALKAMNIKPIEAINDK